MSVYIYAHTHTYAQSSNWSVVYLFQDCKRKRDSHLICYFPNITEPLSSSNLKLPQHLSYGFRMDNVMSLLNLTNDLGTVEVQENPIFIQFNEKVKSHLYTNEYLTINVSQNDWLPFFCLSFFLSFSLYQLSRDYFVRNDFWKYVLKVSLYII